MDDRDFILTAILATLALVLYLLSPLAPTLRGEAVLMWASALCGLACGPAAARALWCEYRKERL